MPRKREPITLKVNTELLDQIDEMRGNISRDVFLHETLSKALLEQGEEKNGDLLTPIEDDETFIEFLKLLEEGVEEQEKPAERAFQGLAEVEEENYGDISEQSTIKVIDTLEVPAKDLVVEPKVEPAKDTVVEPRVKPAENTVVEPKVEPAKDLVVEPRVEPAKDLVVEPKVEPAKDLVVEPRVEPAEDLVVEPRVEPAEDILEELIKGPAEETRHFEEKEVHPPMQREQTIEETNIQVLSSDKVFELGQDFGGIKTEFLFFQRDMRQALDDQKNDTKAILERLTRLEVTRENQPSWWHRLFRK